MSQRIAVIDYGSGNLRSVEKALERAAREIGVGAIIKVTSDPNEIRMADRLVLPGVGAFGACMTGLSASAGVLEAMEHVALVDARPFLGICVGMQLLAEKGLEFGEYRGLGWIPGMVSALSPTDVTVRTPHMGWNSVDRRASHPLIDNIGHDAFYFAHSYHFEVENSAHKIATTVHGQSITAIVARDNIAGVQFHPEKSQHAGITLLKNFLTWESS